MRSPTLGLAGLIALLLIAPHGGALHCNGDITTISAGGETLYLDDRSDPSSGTSLWLYLERNDVDGLQSGGDCGTGKCHPLFPADPCAHSDPDILLHGVLAP